MIHIKKFTFNPFMENTYLLYDKNGKGVVIDPGCYERYEKEELDTFVKENNITIKKLINTHCHIDHVFGNKYVKDRYKVPFLIHKADLETLRAVKAYAPAYGFQHFEELEPDEFMKEGDTIKVGEIDLKVFFTPGHSPGHVVLVNEKEKICIGGDVLFQGSIGRTDLPGGDFDTLISSIREKLFTLDDDVVVYPGHGQETTIGIEKRTNPFCGLNK
ncbi:MAG: MBL fold metallo-hydrolase [Candidatus Cyclobacteriaceae bacterium M2_1C_046]